MAPKPKSLRKRTNNLKENVAPENISKLKLTGKIVKSSRKALTDKTNSGSDENETFGTVLKDKCNAESLRPKRNRRLPSRFIDKENICNDLTNDKVIAEKHFDVSGNHKPIPLKAKNNIIVTDVFSHKTPQKDSHNNSLVVNRPKRVHRLPPKYADHSMSPSKFIPLQICLSSTPINKQDKLTKKVQKKNDNKQKAGLDLKNAKNGKAPPRPSRRVNTEKQSTNDISHRKRCADKNNNPENQNIIMDHLKQDSYEESGHYVSNKKTGKLNFSQRMLENKTYDKKAGPNPKNVKKRKAPPRRVNTEKQSTNDISQRKRCADRNNNPENQNLRMDNLEQDSYEASGNYVSNKNAGKLNFSQRMLENKKQSPKRIEERLAVYEFTYDPNEEPPPQKKKRKRVAKKKAPKPKTYFLTQNYDKNVSKALENLKNQMKNIPVSNNKSNSVNEKNTDQASNLQNRDIQQKTEKINSDLKKQDPPLIEVTPLLDNVESRPTNCEINYSPVYSPILDRPETPRAININDPLNLEVDDNISFFDDIPVASSSLNVSKHPHASPWRVQVELPVKRPVSMYVKPNMTPAFESSFIDDQALTTKKHVYTNILSEPHDDGHVSTVKRPLNDVENWKQTSIMSFIKEVTERKLKKKLTPVKSNSVFNDSPIDLEAITQSPLKTHYKKSTPDTIRNPDSPKTTLEGDSKSKTPERSLTPGSSGSKCSVHSKTESVGKTPLNQKNSELVSKKPSQKLDIDNCFGFDNTSESDQENLVPKRNLDRKRVQSLKPRSRAVLQELNRMGPIRAKMPRAAKMKNRNTEQVNKIYEQLQTQVEEVENNDINEESNSDKSVEVEARNNMGDEDSQSIHLFEDIQIVHHHKPSRKSYGKAKKVTFRQPSNSDTDTRDLNDSVDDEDMEDKTFKLPTVKVVKKTAYKKKVQKFSKKEEEEAEAWAANFNSMCEDIEEFPLIVE